MEQPTYKLLAPLIKGPHWKLIEEYVAGEKERLVTRILSCSESELKGLQGQVKALDTLVAVKATLKQAENR